jgi:hypothetical protein
MSEEHAWGASRARPQLAAALARDAGVPSWWWRASTGSRSLSHLLGIVEAL